MVDDDIKNRTISYTKFISEVDMDWFLDQVMNRCMMIYTTQQILNNRKDTQTWNNSMILTLKRLKSTNNRIN